MALIAVRMEQKDLEALKARSAELRIPFTVLARSLICQGLKDDKIDELTK